MIGFSDIEAMAPGFEIRRWQDKGGPLWYQLDKGYLSTTGRGKDVYKAFVQPVPERQREAAERAIAVLGSYENAHAKLASFDLDDYWAVPHNEKLVFYFASEPELAAFVNSLSAEFRADAYLHGSAGYLIEGRYAGDYGARFTQQVNPLVHVRSGSSTLHKLLGIAARGGSLFKDDIDFLAEVCGVEVVSPAYASSLLSGMELSREAMASMRNVSLGEAGIISVRIGQGTHILDPRRSYVIGRNGDLPLHSESASRKHASVSYCDSGYWLENLGANGTVLGGKKVSNVRLEPGMRLFMGTDAVEVGQAIV